MPRNQSSRRTPGRKRRIRWLRWGIGTAGVVLVAMAGWVANNAAHARDELLAAQADVADFQAGFGSNQEAAVAALRSADGHLSSAIALTSDPVWRIASATPWIGEQLNAIATVSFSLGTAVHQGILPLIDSGLTNPKAFLPSNGQVDLASVATLAEPAAKAHLALTEASGRIDRIRAETLLSPIADAVRSSQKSLDVATEASGAIENATRLLPSMLGADEPKHILLLFQNNAEWRSLGGIASSLALVEAKDGKLALVDQASSADFPKFAEPVLPLDEESVNVFGTQPGRWIQNVTQIPEYAQGAALAREMWMQTRGGSVDQVVTVDPVTLSYVLEATGPIRLSSGIELNAENAVQTLLSDVYQALPNPVAQDRFFAETAATIFDKLSTGDVAPRQLIAALTQAAGERRLLMWSSSESEQALIEPTSLAGRLPVNSPTSTGVGVYLNDATGSKMDYWMRADASAEWVNTHGSMQITLNLSNTAPSDAADSLPKYVTGDGAFGVAPGSSKTVVYMLLPKNFTFVNDSSTLPSATRSLTSYGGRPVVVWTVELAPGQQGTFTVNASGRGTRDITVIETPRIPQP